MLEGQAGVLQQEFGMEVAGGRLHSLPDVMGGALSRPRELPRLLLALAGAFGGDGSLDAHKACQVSGGAKGSRQSYSAFSFLIQPAGIQSRPLG